MAAEPLLDPALLAGTPYAARGVIAEGEMGLVLDAERDGQRVVVKVLRPDLAGEPGLRERLLAEAEVLARLRHPNLVAVQDFGVTPRGEAYVVTERLEGRPLSELIAQHGALPVPVALLIARQALLGLGHAHEHGVVHREIKPSNLFVCGEGDAAHVKLIDFGIAKLAPPGSPWFMAPEQLLGRSVTPATDIYAMGLVMYQMLAGKHPFARHDSGQAARDAHLAEMPPAVSKLRGEPVPAALERALLRAVAKAPQDRFATTAKFFEALEHAVPSARELVTLATLSPAPAVTTLPSTVPGYMPYDPPDIAVVSAAPATLARGPARVTTWCWVAAIVGLAWHACNAAMTMAALADPEAVLPGAASGVRRMASAALPRHVMLFGAAASLAVILRGARTDGERAKRRARLWLRAFIAIIVVALGIDLVSAPLAASYAGKAAPMLASVAVPIAVVHACATAAIHVGVLLLVQKWRT